MIRFATQTRVPVGHVYCLLCTLDTYNHNIMLTFLTLLFSNNVISYTNLRQQFTYPLSTCQSIKKVKEKNVRQFFAHWNWDRIHYITHYRWRQRNFPFRVQTILFLIYADNYNRNTKTRAIFDGVSRVIGNDFLLRL